MPVIVIPVSSTLIRQIFEPVRRIVIGPRRTPAERRVTLIGALLGAAVGSGIGLLFFGWGYFSDPMWQTFSPPLEPLLLLPIPGGLAAGLRFTTELTRPARVSWRRVLAVSVGAVFVAVGSLTLMVVEASEVMNLGPDVGAVVQGAIGGLVVAAVMAPVWTVFPGLIVMPVVIPAVAVVAIVVRRLSRERAPLQPVPAPPAAVVGR